MYFFAKVILVLIFTIPLLFLAGSCGTKAEDPPCWEPTASYNADGTPVTQEQIEEGSALQVFRRVDCN
ncbi:MAG: hypothetical protein LBE38_09890 [Deltaproteobacteria bacterium]|nr:hypothetical protein [Deltaproteobacteria bacterium]